MLGQVFAVILAIVITVALLGLRGKIMKGGGQKKYRCILALPLETFLMLEREQTSASVVQLSLQRGYLRSTIRIFNAETSELWLFDPSGRFILLQSGKTHHEQQHYIH